MRRRDFVATAASVAFIPSPKVGPYQDPVYLREIAGRLAHERYQHGGLPAVSAALRHLRKAAPAIAGSDRRLQEAASELASETARILYDARRYDAAEQAGVFALRLARRSGDSTGQAAAYSTLSRICIDQRRGERGAMYARCGLLLPGVPAAQEAWLRLRLGRSLALIRGQERPAREALAGALSTEGLPLHETADMVGNVGVALAGLREYDEAQTAIAEAARLGGRCSPLLLVAYRAWEVEAAFLARRPTMAAERMTELARIVPLVSSARVDNHLDGIIAMAGRWAGLREMRESREQLRAVTRP